MSKLKVKEIYSDERGKILILEGDELKEHEEVTILITKKGFARGGCIHERSDEFSTVLEGEVDYYMEYKPFPWAKLKKGDIISVPKGTPHYFLAKTDCIVMEWGPAPDDNDKKDKKMRAKVEKINEQNKES